MTIFTERLELRSTNDNDREVLFSVLTHPYVRKYLLDDEVLNMDQVEDFLKVSIDNFNSKGYGLWLLESRETHLVMGVAGLWDFFDEGQPQLLYALLPQYTGYGYAMEAAKAIIDYSFNDLKFVELLAGSDEPNLSSHKVAERLGMTKEKMRIVNEKPLVFYKIKNNS